MSGVGKDGRGGGKREGGGDVGMVYGWKDGLGA